MRFRFPATSLFLAACGAVALADLAVPVVQEEWPGQSRPVWEQLNREMASLYRDVSPGVARVQLPPLRSSASSAAILDRWQGKINPQVQQQLTLNAGTLSKVEVRVSATQASSGTLSVDVRGEATPTSQAWVVTHRGESEMVIESRGTGPGATMMVLRPTTNGKPQIEFKPTSEFAPNTIGILLDDQGHLLVSGHMDAPDEKAQIRVAVGSGQVVPAAFVGSDRQTALSVLRVPAAQGKPVRLSSSRPDDGSLVMVVSPNSSQARLVVWSGKSPEYGVVVKSDGTVAGFARSGQFLSSSLVRPVVEQIIRTGQVQRSPLGLRVRQVAEDDPIRREQSALGGLPALRVDDVSRGSAADRAGLLVGDFVLAIADEPVGDTPSFAAVLAAQTEATDLKIIRAGHVQTLTLKASPSTRPSKQ